MTLPKGYGLNNGQVVRLTPQQVQKAEEERQFAEMATNALIVLNNRVDPITANLIKVLLANGTITNAQLVKEIVQYHPIINDADLVYGTYKEKKNNGE